MIGYVLFFALENTRTDKMCGTRGKYDFCQGNVYLLKVWNRDIHTFIIGNSLYGSTFLDKTILEYFFILF